MPGTSIGGVETHPTVSPQPLLQAIGVQKSFAGRPVLRGIDLRVATGEVVAIIGPSGSGKSTLLRCLNRLEVPDRGQVLFHGVDICAPGTDIAPVRRRIGMVFQQFNLFPRMTALQNNALAPAELGLCSARQAQARARELLARVHLPEGAEQLPSELSGGQQQRVAIARALAVEPEVLLFDEVTSALDPRMSERVLAVMRELSAGKRTLIMVTHETGFARQVADRVVFLADGQIVEQGSPASVLGHPNAQRTREFVTGGPDRHAE